MTFPPPQSPHHAIKQLRHQISNLQADNERLLREYGTGVRPSWVSGDIGYNEMLIEGYRKQITTCEAMIAQAEGNVQ